MIAWHIAALGLYHGGLLLILLYGLYERREYDV